MSTAGPPHRLGILGGTFDPVHVGHVVAAVDVRAELGLDRVLMVPAGDPWQKRGQVVVASPEQRFAMAELACAALDGVEVSRVELDGAGPSVTADTLERLELPGQELFLLLGADAVANMPTWRRLEETRDLAAIAVVERAGEHAEPPGAGLALRARHDPAPGRLVVGDPPPRRRRAADRRPHAAVRGAIHPGRGPLHSRLMAQGAGGTVLDEPPQDPHQNGARTRRSRPFAPGGARRTRES